MDVIVFACVHNAGRSQMAAALFNQRADPARARAVSAGTDPGPAIHPEVLTVMREVGINLTGVTPRKLTPDLADGARALITMGCGDQCPVIPGAMREDWPLDDPKGRSIDEVRAIRDDILARVDRLIAAHGWAR